METLLQYMLQAATLASNKFHTRQHYELKPRLVNVILKYLTEQPLAALIKYGTMQATCKHLATCKSPINVNNL